MTSAAVIGVISVGSADLRLAYWTANGTGASSARSGSMAALTVDALVGGDTPSSTLVPGGTADVVLRVRNPNGVSVQLVSVSANGPGTADAAHAGCTGVTFTAPPSPLSPRVTVAAAESLLVHLAGAASMDKNSPSACQGATFRLPVTAIARQ